jgi:hypothetical protein
MRLYQLINIRSGEQYGRHTYCSYHNSDNQRQYFLNRFHTLLG